MTAMSTRTRQAWIALALTIVSFVLGTFVGEGIYSLLGYETGSDAPLLPTLLSAVPAIAVVVSAPLAAWWLGRAAVAGGDPRGRTPMLVGIVVAVGFALLNVAAALSG
jgi:fatty acid desaturase